MNSETQSIDSLKQLYKDGGISDELMNFIYGNWEDYENQDGEINMMLLKQAFYKNQYEWQEWAQDLPEVDEE